MPVDMNRVCSIAAAHGLKVVEDCALSLGGRLDGKHTGLYGTVGCFSFYPVKHITTAEGGALITNDGELAAKIRLASAFGVDKHHGVRKVAGVYDAISLGFNYRMCELHAALGVQQLKRLPGFLEKRAENHAYLAEQLREVEGLHLFDSAGSGFESSHYCLSMLLQGRLSTHRDALKSALKGLGVGTSIYYPRPVPAMSYYQEKYGYTEGSYPNAEEIASRSIALPVGPHLGPRDAEYIAESVKNAIRDLR
jgi:dTDP-4-amino-4,6-dideoxygalactose transaminase